MKKILFIFTFVFVGIAFANTGAEAPSNFDIVPRVINFVVFLIIVIYLVKKPIKNMLVGRTASIASVFENIQVMINEAKIVKEQSVKDLETAKNNAISLVEAAKKEAKNYEEKAKITLANELSQMDKDFENKKEFESRKIIKTIVSEVLSEVFDNDSIKLEQDKLIDIIQKKAV